MPEEGLGADLENVPAMLRSIGLFAMLGLFASGCSGALAPASAPPITPEAAVAETLPSAPGPRFAHLPQPAPCEPAASDRCPAEILHAAALSWLGKTTAEYDGIEMKVVSHDEAQVQAEARADAAFAELLLSADVAPRDGHLDRAESAAVEARVLALMDETT